MIETAAPKNPRGRPRKTSPQTTAPQPKAPQKVPATAAEKYKAKFADASRWGGRFASADEDRLSIDPELIKQLESEGIALGWKVQSVFGQEQRQAISVQQRNGWQYVQPGDIPGIDVVEVDGLRLMARPMAVHRKAKELEQREARAPIDVMHNRHMLGDLPHVSLDPGHPSARNYNHHRKSVERINIPQD